MHHTLRDELLGGYDREDLPECDATLQGVQRG